MNEKARQDTLPPVAFYGDQGIDVFEASYFATAARFVYECAGTFTQISDYEELRPYKREARQNPEKYKPLRDMLRRAEHLDTPWRLGHLTDFPRGFQNPADTTAIMFRIAFLRQWLIADLSITQFEKTVADSAGRDFIDSSSALRLLLDFNQISRAMALLDQLGDGFLAPLASPRFRDDEYGNASYAARLVGDLYFRAEQMASALTAFELSVKVKDNKLKRRRCIEVAQALKDIPACLRHIDMFETNWGLPDDLKRLRHSLIGHTGLAEK